MLISAIDESGNIDSEEKTKFLVLTATITKNFYEYIKVRENVTNFKKSKGIEHELKATALFHRQLHGKRSYFSKYCKGNLNCLKNLAKEIYSLIPTLSASYLSVVIKSEIKNKGVLYYEGVKSIVKELLTDDAHPVIIFDTTPYFKEVIMGASEEGVTNVIFESSKNDELLQLSDLVGYIVFRKYYKEKDKDFDYNEYFEIIKDRVKIIPNL